MTTVTTSLLPANAGVRKIYIQRDYSRGLGVRFSPTFPPDLNGRIDSDKFDFVINKVNKIFDEAEKVSLYTILDSLFGCLTAYLIFACCDSHYDRCLKKVTRLIEEQNESVWKPKGLLLTDPKDRGLRVIEITLLEPTVQPNGSPTSKDLSGYHETALE